MASTDSLSLPTHGIQRQDLKFALAKTMELRALHAALLQGNTTSPALHSIQFRSSPSLSRSSNQLSAEDYPVFTPSYEEEPLPGYHYIHPENQSISESRSAIGFEEEAKDNFDIVSDTKSLNRYTNNQFSKRSLCKNQLSVLPNATGIDMCKPSSRRTSSSEFTTFNTSNTFKPAMISKESDTDQKNPKNIVVSKPLNDKHKGAIFSWMFFKSRKKPKSGVSPNAFESEDMSQILKDWGVLSVETLKKELLEANENKDTALAEVSEMKSSLGELQQKMVNLESYCEELKKALKHAMQGKEASKRTKPLSGTKESSMPLSEEVMVEGFLQIVTEARLSVKQFCKTLVNHIEEDGNDLMEKLHQMAMSNKYSKGVLYHLESLINQSLYQDFENCVFQKNGSPKIFDPQQDHLEKFSSFVTLRSLSWNGVLQKGTKYYSEDFSRFCDHKMSDIVSALNWSRPWPEQLLQSFFVSAKCIWLLHLLAFSFNPPLVILRVDEDRNFDPLYMEDVLFDKQIAQTPAKVKIMVMPGFYVKDRVLRCRVLCRYRSVP